MEEGSNPFDKVVHELEQFIGEQKLKEIELRQQLYGLQAETRRATRALEVLMDRKVNQRRSTAPPEPTKQAKARQAKQNWIPSAEKLQAVRDVLADLPQTSTQIAEAAGMARETATRALELLRAQQEVRMAGMVNAGKSSQKVKSYALMPTAPTESPNGTP